MALSTQKGCSFYAFEFQASISPLVCGPCVCEQFEIYQNYFLHKECINIHTNFWLYQHRDFKTLKVAKRKSRSNFDMTALIVYVKVMELRTTHSFSEKFLVLNSDFTFNSP